MKNQKHWIQKLRKVCNKHKIPMIRFEAGPYQPAGISDCMIRHITDLGFGVNIFIEVKASGKLTDLQERFLKTFGGCCWYPNRKENKIVWYGLGAALSIEIDKILNEVMT